VYAARSGRPQEIKVFLVLFLQKKNILRQSIWPHRRLAWQRQRKFQVAAHAFWRETQPHVAAAFVAGPAFQPPGAKTLVRGRGHGRATGGQGLFARRFLLSAQLPLNSYRTTSHCSIRMADSTRCGRSTPLIHFPKQHF
jgi:hypothetical protein